MVAYSQDDYRWWKRNDVAEKDENAHRKLIDIVRRIRKNQDYRKRANLLHASLYGAIPVQGLAVNAYTRTTPGTQTALSLNICKNMVKAMVSKIGARGLARPFYATEDGDIDKELSAESLTKGIGGILYKEQYQQKHRGFIRDGLVFGTGFLKVWADFDEAKVAIRRTLPFEVTVEDGECREGDPPSFHETRYEDKSRLIRRFPDYEDRIDLLREREDDQDGGSGYPYENTSQQCRTYESFHLPSGPGADDGRHVLAIETATLIDERWDKTRFPYPRFYWDRPLVGYFGVGLVEDLSGIQWEINKILREIQTGLHLIKGYWAVESASKVAINHIQNDLARIMKYSGTQPPTYYSPQIIPQEVYQHLWNLVAQGYKISGISEMNATSAKPPGLDSGEAQREFKDTQTERFLEAAQEADEAVLEVASHVQECARELSKKRAYEVRAVDDETFETIKWRDLADPDGFVMKVQPTSTLPTTISGKTALAQDMLQLGAFDMEDVLDTVQMPDTSKVIRRKLASRKNVELAMRRIVVDGVYESPEPYMNLVAAKMVATECYLVYRAKKVAEDRLSKIRDYLDELEGMIQDAKASAAPPPVPSGVPTPQAPGVGAPISPAPGMNGVQPPVGNA